MKTYTICFVEIGGRIFVRGTTEFAAGDKESSEFEAIDWTEAFAFGERLMQAHQRSCERIIGMALGIKRSAIVAAPRPAN